MDGLLVKPWRQPSTQQNPADREFISISDITWFIRQYSRFIICCIAFAMLCAWSYIITTDPIYTARAQVLIDPKIPQLLQQQAAEVNLSLDTAQVESQIAVMESEKIANMVIDGLGLRDDPGFNRSYTPPMADRFRKLKAAFDKAVGPLDSAWLRSVGEAVARRLDNWNTEHPALSEFEGDRRTMSMFRNGLGVKRMGVSYAIEISFRSRDPEQAARIANATTDALVREQVETKAAAAREGGAWLERRLKEMRMQMNAATQVAQAFRAKHDYRVGPATGATLVDGQVVYDDKQPDVDEPTLEELEVTADTYRKMYESFLQAFTNSVSQQSYPVADARVITVATPPLSASHPRSTLVLAFGALAGLMAGTGFAVLRHALDRTLKSPRQIREEFGLECVGELPPAALMRGGFGRMDEVARSPRSTFSVSLKGVKTAISFAHAPRPMRCVGITSALPGDGKSSCASNLAMLYSMCGVDTLLIDADLDHSILSKKLRPLAKTPDATDEWKPEPAIWRITKATNRGFDMLPSSVTVARNLLAPKSMEALLAELQSYDMIIVDLPPLTSGSDWLAVSSLLDGVILVAEWGKTPVDVLGELVRSMHASKTSIIGVVMTKVRAMSTKHYKRHGARLPT
jgi:uncharacterized protein involved in exopolysaccharide biosynthesis/Mrp family chromosome partitioning ATPase